MSALDSADAKRKTKMKKLMVLLAAVASAAALQAAQVDWTIATKSFTSKDGSSYVVTSYLLAFDSSTAYSTFADKLGTGDITFDTAVSDYSVGSATGNNSSKKLGNVDTTLTSAKLSEGSSYYFAVFSSSGEKDYILSTTAVGTAYDPNGDVETEGIKAAFVATSFSSGWQTVTTSNVPEPTSGLLMLLGVAGLALRRRRLA